MAELDTIVEDAIKYLQEGVTTATDHEHLKPLAFNHVDSLLLADKVRNMNTRVKLSFYAYQNILILLHTVL